MRVPNHIAIILDGNGRWEKSKGMPRNYGHVKGCENLEDICEVAKELGVKYLTVYAFSTENWKRSKEEVEGFITGPSSIHTPYFVSTFVASCPAYPRSLLRVNVGSTYV